MIHIIYISILCGYLLPYCIIYGTYLISKYYISDDATVSITQLVCNVWSKGRQETETYIKDDATRYKKDCPDRLNILIFVVKDFQEVNFDGFRYGNVVIYLLYLSQGGQKITADMKALSIYG